MKKRVLRKGCRNVCTDGYSVFPCDKKKEFIYVTPWITMKNIYSNKIGVFIKHNPS